MKVWILAKRENFNKHSCMRFDQAAKKMGIELITVAPEELDLITTKEGKKSIHYNGSCVDLPDVLIPRMGAATPYFALAVIRHMQNLGVLVLNSSASIEVAKDKMATLQKLTTHNVPIPKTMLAKFPLNLSIVENEFTYPIILKTVSGSLGKGVFLCESRSKLEDVMDLIEISSDSRINIILQEFVSTSKGRDIRVIIIGGKPIGAMLRTAKKGKFKANFSAGGKVTPFELNPTVEWLAVESTKLLGLDIAGVDILFDGDNYKICEVNSSPMFEGFEQATGIDVPKAIFEYAKLRLGQKPL